MFGRKPAVQEVRNVTVIELSDESRQALVSLDSDIQTLREFMQDVSAKASQIMAALHGEIVAQLPVEARAWAAEDAKDGIQVFEGERVELPGHMTENEEMASTIPDKDRVRSTPFTRAPRHVQVNWLTQVMADGAWYGAVVVAREYATDERHYRYMRGAVTARLREMHEEGLVERRDSKAKGSMFEYRLIPRLVRPTGQ